MVANGARRRAGARRNWQVKKISLLFGIAGADSAAPCRIASVRIDLDHLPDDPALLQQMLRQAVHEQNELQAENDKLALLIQRLVRHQFGARSEQLTTDQLQLGLEDLEQTVAANQAAQEAAASEPRSPRTRSVESGPPSATTPTRRTRASSTTT